VIVAPPLTITTDEVGLLLSLLEASLESVGRLPYLAGADR
jgi:hypothetical protein